MIKICFAASSGGHLEQLMMLKKLMKKYNSFVLTEKTLYTVENEDIKTYYLQQVNRKEKTFFLRMAANFIYTLYIWIKEKPDIVISTGVLSTIPVCMLAKIFRKKIIYIESFAKVSSPTETGKLIYKFADQFLVQLQQMTDIYQKAIYKVGIY
ncbi:PssD/Cps14F family polysaccharide biosynthesis glycosyltransferase [Robinsoniella sp.]|uniref:PssD/Cps14F family polysaccharide biosynthesis glycosyltransferase n=1 Tax=Robinsoniella sp. TaxID=2496533 RepID=UPI003752F101